MVVSTDIEIALAAAFDEGPGIVVSAGTGSVAVGRDRAGKRHRIGGYGWQMGDEGSGYAIGRAALGAVSRAADGRSPAHRAERARARRPPGATTSTRWCAGRPARRPPRWPRSRRTCSTWRRTATSLAQGIADYAARELTQLAVCLLPTMDVEPPVGVAVTGGLLTTDGPLRRSVLARLREEPGLMPMDGPVDAVVGALRLAAREGARAASAAWRRRGPPAAPSRLWRMP